MGLNSGKDTRARVYCSEKDRHHGAIMYEAILQEAHSMKLAGCTVFPGVEGFGASTMVHSARALRIEEDMPMVVEVVDGRNRLEGFLRRVKSMLAEGSSGSLITLEDVDAVQYHPAVDWRIEPGRESTHTAATAARGDW